MSEPEIRNESVPNPTGPVSESKSADDSPDAAIVRWEIQRLMIAVLVVSGTLSAFLYFQARWVKRDLQIIQGPANQIIQSFKQEKPLMDAFISKVADYGKTHPDIHPLLQKYGVMTNATASTSAAPKTATIPATAPAAK